MDHSLQAQELRIENYLRKHGSITTPEARHQLDIVMPAPRIHTLRHKRGLNITTIMVKDRNPGGSVHRFARYVLQKGKYQGGKQ